MDGSEEDDGDHWCQSPLVQGVGDGDVLIVDFPSGSLLENRVLCLERFLVIVGISSSARSQEVNILDHAESTITGTTGSTSARGCTWHRRLLWSPCGDWFLFKYITPFYGSLPSWYLHDFHTIILVFSPYASKDIRRWKLGKMNKKSAQTW